MSGIGKLHAMNWIERRYPSAAPLDSRVIRHAPFALLLAALGTWSCGEEAPAELEATVFTAQSQAALTCPAGTADCDGNSANGCEAVLASDNNHCNGCGNVCPAASGYSCSSGRCISSSCQVSLSFPVAGHSNISPTAAAYSASGWYQSETPNYAGNVCPGAWNGGGAPAWWEARFSSPRPIRGVTLFARMTPSGNVHHLLETSDDGIEYTVRKEIIQWMNEGVQYPFDFGTPIMTRFLRVRTLSSSSWVSWHEVGIFSAPASSQYDASMLRARQTFGAATTSEGKVFVVGGTGSTTSYVEQYDAAGNRWVDVAPLPSPRVDMAVVAVGTKVYVIGGSQSGTYTNTLFEYNPATNTWTQKAPMANRRTQFAAAVFRGKIYVFSGVNGGPYVKAVEVYDPATNTWTVQTTMPNGTASRYPSAVEAGGKIYILGGRALEETPTSPYNPSSTNKVTVYDPVANTWSTAASMPTRRHNLTAVKAGNGRIYAVGGETYTYVSSTNYSTTYLTTVEEYDPATNTWVSFGNLGIRRTRLGGTLLPANGKIWACPGLVDTGVMLPTYQVVRLAHTPKGSSSLGSSADDGGCRRPRCTRRSPGGLDAAWRTESGTPAPSSSC